MISIVQNALDAAISACDQRLLFGLVETAGPFVRFDREIIGGEICLDVPRRKNCPDMSLGKSKRRVSLLSPVRRLGDSSRGICEL
jgi:hypothetical protein